MIHTFNFFVKQSIRFGIAAAATAAFGGSGVGGGDGGNGDTVVRYILIFNLFIFSFVVPFHGFDFF